MACELELKLFLKSVGGDRANWREMQWEMKRGGGLMTQNWLPETRGSREAVLS